MRFGRMTTTNEINAIAAPKIIKGIGAMRVGINRYWRRCCIHAPRQIMITPIAIAINAISRRVKSMASPIRTSAKHIRHEVAARLRDGAAIRFQVLRTIRGW